MRVFFIAVLLGCLFPAILYADQYVVATNSSVLIRDVKNIGGNTRFQILSGYGENIQIRAATISRNQFEVFCVPNRARYCQIGGIAKYFTVIADGAAGSAVRVAK
jgi:hypothetical protein